ncbi:hypothetical protein RJ639_015387 [Escallonia herrerae]|uniref:Uncharacterized protein n=1 Tax=Escallonia herrerae TaxID=1293975 RepID=A0AA88VIS0_9ASTE|nr:hypothetical protein RJ639_015387 [Escallonia herrerae]
MQTKPSIVGICWRTLLASGKSSATHGFLYAIKGHRVSGGIEAAVAQGTVASSKKILWDSLLRKTMANTKERIDALEAQIRDMIKSDPDAPGILKQFSLRLDALGVNLEATDNARYAENMEWEGRFQELQDRVEHYARHVEGIDWESKFQELQDRVELLSRTVVNTPAGGVEHASRPRVPEPKSYGGAREAKEVENFLFDIEQNFLFDIEQYFRAIRVDSEARRRCRWLPWGQAPNQSWGSKNSWASNSSTQQKSGVGFKAKPDASTSEEVKKPPFRGCFLCQGPHVIANCPQRQMMNAFFDNIGQVQRGAQSGSQSRHPLTEEQTDVQYYEEEDAVEVFPQWCNAVTTQVGNPEESLTEEKPKDMPPKKRAMYQGKARWQELLAAFNFMLEYRAGSTNSVADALSRRAELDQEDKVERKKKAGLLQPLPVPKRPWESVSLDFITSLPKVEDLGTILVVVDRFSKYVSFIATPKYCSAEDTAQLFFKYVVKYWGVPQDIVSDRDSRFTGNFWTELFKLFGSQLSMSSSYHPESDGQMERFNSMLEEYLCHFVSATQKNWVKLLDVAQLCFNSRKSSSTWKSAFEIVNGQQPLLAHTVNVPNARKSPRAISFSEEWRQNIDLVHSYLEKATRRMKKHADKNRRSQEFNVGDKVMVKLLPQDRKFLKGRDSRLLQKYEGPLTIVKKIGKMAYKVDPPHWWSCQLHPVFHVSMLKPFCEDTADPSRGQIRRQGLKPKAAGKRVAKAILNDRVITASRKRHQEYLVKWQGHMDEENTWEQASDLSAYADKIEAYHMQKLTRASTALVGENVTGCPLHPPSTAPPRPSSSAPPRPSNMSPCALASSSSLAPMRLSSTAPARPIAVPTHAKSQP